MSFSSAALISLMVYVPSTSSSIAAQKSESVECANVLGPTSKASSTGADPGFREREFRCVKEGVALLILSHPFLEIDHEMISTVILLPSAESFKKGCCQLQAKVCARSTG